MIVIYDIVVGIHFFFVLHVVVYQRENGQVYEISHANENVIKFEVK